MESDYAVVVGVSKSSPVGIFLSDHIDRRLAARRHLRRTSHYMRGPQGTCTCPIRLRRARAFVSTKKIVL